MCKVAEAHPDSGLDKLWLKLGALSAPSFALIDAKLCPVVAARCPVVAGWPLSPQFVAQSGPIYLFLWVAYFIGQCGMFFVGMLGISAALVQR